MYTHIVCILVLYFTKMADKTELGNFNLERDFLLMPIMDNEFDTIDDEFWDQLKAVKLQRKFHKTYQSLS